ncbi:MAG TPA: hypothetical protein VGO47_05595 [Chlamydiales bacterium]|nr:hypothetical protein [Chlamydiales bacterium]
MPFRHISRDIKIRALWMLDNGYLPDEIEVVLDVSNRSLRRWSANFEEYGDVIPPHNPVQGRPPVLTATQIHALLDFINASPEMFLDEIRDFLILEHDVLVSISTLHDLIQAAGLTYKLLRRNALERDEIRRRLWLEDVQARFVANQLVWTDESSKDDRTIYRHYGRSRSGQRASIPAQFVRGDRYSILPALTIDGYIALRIVKDSVDGGEFFDFVVEELVCLLAVFHLLWLLMLL